MTSEHIEAEVTIEVKVETIHGKTLRLRREGDEVEIITPVSLKTPRVKVNDLIAAMAALKGKDQAV